MTDKNVEDLVAKSASTDVQVLLSAKESAKRAALSDPPQLHEGLRPPQSPPVRNGQSPYAYLANLVWARPTLKAAQTAGVPALAAAKPRRRDSLPAASDAAQCGG